MNIILILASGVGNRFGDPIPKQYHLVRGRPAIEYVINTAITSSADEVVVVTSEKYAQQISDRYGITVTTGGTERNLSVKKGLDYIHDHYSCDKVIIMDAVCPLVKPELINRYFQYLDEYDIVFTALKIPVSIGNYDAIPMDRSKYFMMASPEGYRFTQLYQYFDDSVLTDSIMHQLPDTLKRKPCFEMRDFAKIIYPHDIAVIEAIMQEREKKRIFCTHLNDFTLSLLKRLREPFPEQIKKWEKYIDKDIEYLFLKWNIIEFSVNQNANSSIVFEAFSEVYGNIIIKITPPCYASRYQVEHHLLTLLPNEITCKIIDKDDERMALLLERAQPGDYVHWNDGMDAVKRLFSFMKSFTLPLDQKQDMFRPFLDFFAYEIETANQLLSEDVVKSRVLSQACNLYQTHFMYLPQRLIHGDICYKNLLKSSESSLLIDPLGLIAPIEIEFANYFAYELFDNYGCHKEIYKNITDTFTEYMPSDELDRAVFVTLTIKLWATCLCGTNGNKQNADVWFGIITDLFLDSQQSLKNHLL